MSAKSTSASVSSPATVESPDLITLLANLSLSVNAMNARLTKLESPTVSTVGGQTASELARARAAYTPPAPTSPVPQAPAMDANHNRVTPTEAPMAVVIAGQALATIAKVFTTGSRGFSSFGKITYGGRRYQVTCNIVEIGSKPK